MNQRHGMIAEPGEVDGLIGPAGNHYDKYGSTNPIARFLMDGFLASLRQLLPKEINADSFILEVGCGEGHLIDLMRHHYALSCPKLLGLDIDEEVISEAKANYPDLNFAVKNIYHTEELGLPQKPDLVICCEVLEHLADPGRAIEAILKLGCDQFIFSVPREPLWRVLNVSRLKYLSAFGNTPGHVQHWSKGSFEAFLGKYFDIETVLSPLPWTMIKVKRKS